MEKLDKKYGPDVVELDESKDNEIEYEMQEKRMQKMLKDTLFKRCEQPLDLFNTNRMVKIKIKQILARFGFLMLRDGTLEVKGIKKPDLAVP
jgi:hypothetical protein